MFYWSTLRCSNSSITPMPFSNDCQKDYEGERERDKHRYLRRTTTVFKNNGTWNRYCPVQEISKIMNEYLCFYKNKKFWKISSSRAHWMTQKTVVQRRFYKLVLLLQLNDRLKRGTQRSLLKKSKSFLLLAFCCIILDIVENSCIIQCHIMLAS